MMTDWTERFWRSLPLAGLLAGTLFFAASLTPSLIPRAYAVQGILSGIAFSAGYGAGVFGRWLWAYLELPRPKDRGARIVKQVATLACIAIAMAFLWQASAWQNSIRDLMGMEPVESARPIQVGLIALAVFAVLLGIGRLFSLTGRVVSRRLRAFLPRRIATVAGIAAAAALFVGVANGVLLRYALHAADSSYRAMDELIEDGTSPPDDPQKTGSAASLLKWDDLGRAGRNFVSGGPSARDIGSFLGRPAQEPIRVYAGLGSAETPAERAKLALGEMKRVGAFGKSTLVIVTPTGTGWVDPAAVDTLEYLQGGDVASVAIQYSYLASWLSLLVEPGYGSDASRALFHEVYDYWTTLPKEHRPKLYLYGLSLGAMNSELSNELFEVLGDPYQGALWAGPPFASRIWRSITERRNPGTPFWLPRFRDGAYVRFTSQQNALDIPGAQWGPLRVVYLQYASDSVTFFDPYSFYRAPEWMSRPRGPDVSPQLRWYPLVSFLQSLVDLAFATTTPMGHGHVYAPEHYIDAWVAVMGLQWRPEEIARLKAHFAAR